MTGSGNSSYRGAVPIARRTAAYIRIPPFDVFYSCILQAEGRYTRPPIFRLRPFRSVLSRTHPQGRAALSRQELEILGQSPNCVRREIVVCSRIRAMFGHI